MIRIIEDQEEIDVIETPKEDRSKNQKPVLTDNASSASKSAKSAKTPKLSVIEADIFGEALVANDLTAEINQYIAEKTTQHPPPRRRTVTLHPEDDTALHNSNGNDANDGDDEDGINDDKYSEDD
ncbi:hypothetical protein PtB15_16B96 [Puccinia triticina]|nr:hypothetical protein PtB15_16B96 [Puccinia triticina]